MNPLAKRKWRATGVLLLLVVQPAAATRFSFELVTTTREQLKGGEVCFFPSDPTATPGHRALWTNDVRCYSADQVLAVPPGHWNMYARHADGWITTGRLGMAITGAPEDTDTGYKHLTLDLEPAVNADVTALHGLQGAERRHVTLYFPSTTTTTAFVLPVPNKITSMVVPRGVAFVPLLVEGDTIIRVGELQQLRPQTSGARVQFGGTSRDRPGITHVIVPKDALGSVHSAEGVRIIASIEGTEYEAIAPRTGVTSRDLVLFRDLPRGTGKLRVVGRFWSAQEQSIDTNSERPQRLSPITLERAGAARITIPLQDANLWIGAETPNCHESDEPTRGLTMDVRRCRDGDCRRVRSLALPEGSETAEIDGLLPGDYEIRIRRRRGIFLSMPLTIKAGEVSAATPDIALSTVAGRITRANRGIRARIEMPGGAATSDESGTFFAALSRLAEGDRVRITPCETACTFIVEVTEAHVMLKRVDVDLPAAPLRVVVVDYEKNAPISAAAMRIVSLGDDESVEFNLVAGTTDVSGAAEICGVPLGRDLLACADAEGYVSSCRRVERNRDGRYGELRISMVPTGKFTGRLETTAQLLDPFLFFVTKGNVVEQTRVREDGTFLTSVHYGSDTSAILVARNFPLAVLEVPAAAPGAEMTLHVPAAPQRRLHVLLDPRTSSTDVPVGIAVGRITIPSRAFTFSQAIRGHQAAVSRDRPIEIWLLQTGPIEVIRGFAMIERPPDLGDADEFSHPRYGASLRRRVVTSAEDTIALD